MERQSLAPRRERLGSPVRSVRDALRECRLLFGFAALFGVAVNLLLLTGPLYMLQIYDRVLTSQSIQTLLVLTVLVIVAYAVLGLVDGARVQIVSRAGLRIERLLGERLVSGDWSEPSRSSLARGSDLLRDLDTYRGYIGGQGIIAFMDLPFSPLFVVVIFLLHPWLGVFAAISIVLLTAIALLAQLATRNRLAEARKSSVANSHRVLNVSTAADSVRVMGMGAMLARLWRDERDELVSKQALANDIAGGFKAATKATRFLVQSLILGLGAWLVLRNELSPGGMIAASILLGRGLGPIEQALAAWSQYNAAQSARTSIDVALAEFSEKTVEHRTDLPQITGDIKVEKLLYYAPSMDKPVISQLSFHVAAGISVGILGPSGVGKSTLARLLVGALEPSSGHIRYDGADIRQYDPNRLGQDVGYMSQDVALLEGSVKENIARFQPNRDNDVIEAAQRARVHSMILQLPQGYDTQVGERGTNLSAGQRQRIGLARALFGNPKVIVLDEPNANLDEHGDKALQDTIEEVSALGTTLFVVTHSKGLANVVDALLVMMPDGTTIYGAKNAILNHLAGRGNDVASDKNRQIGSEAKDGG